MKGKVCVITGATSGIGRVTALELARLGAYVILVSRNPDKCIATSKTISDLTGNNTVEPLPADLSSLQEIHGLARKIQERFPKLDLLVNNAGGLFLERRLSVDGLEMTFALNHLSYFALTLSLLDCLKESVPARIVNVASRAHKGATIDFDNLRAEKNDYRGWLAYRRSKLANLLFTYELARRLEGTGITINAMHPGWVATGFAGSNGWMGSLIQGVSRILALTPEQGAETILYLATSPEVEGKSGGYYVKNQLTFSSSASLDRYAARRLWDSSLELANLNEPGWLKPANAAGSLSKD